MKEYFRRFNFQFSGQLLEIGAHYGEEDGLYTEFDIDPIYVEADPEVFSRLLQMLPNRKKHNVAISNKKGKSSFYIANNEGNSSSLSKMTQHTQVFPDVKFVKTIEVECTTVDDLVISNNYDIDVLCLDIQGGEMNALLGAQKTLLSVKAIYLEVHLMELYEGESLLPDFDEFLNKFNFKRVLVSMQAVEEGNALYIRRDFLQETRKKQYFYPDPSKIIQLSDLGTSGRFGNQLLQYAIGKGYCRTYGYTLEIPEDWIGRKIFKNIDDNIITEPFSKNMIRNRCKEGEFNININKSWSMCQDSMSFFTKQEVKQWFQLKDEYRIPKCQDNSMVAHLRRGDYTGSGNNQRFAVITKKSYKNAIEQFGYNYEDVFFVIEKFCSQEYNRWIAKDAYSFLNDFQTIMNADVIFRANSTFSLWAAILSDAKIFSPVVGNKVGWQDDISFVEGNHPSIVHTDHHNHKQWFTDMYLYEYE